MEMQSVSSSSVKTEPKDVFLHLLAMVTLYTSAITFLVLVFQFINYFLPDPLESYYSRESIVGTMRAALAGLVIMFPAYLFTMRALNRSYAAEPMRRGLWVRKWLVYFTLFVATLIILGDLVSLLNHFLEGELTLRFLLKVTAVAFVAGSAFSYYLSDIRKS